MLWNITRTQIIAGRMVLLGVATKSYYEIVTEKEGDYGSDAIATIIYIGEVGFILSPFAEAAIIGKVISSPTTIQIVGIVLAGGIISYLIDTEEGVENYVDFMNATYETSGLSLITRTFGPISGFGPKHEQLGMSEEGAEEFTPTLEILIPEIRENVFPKREPLVLPDSALGWYMLAVQSGARYLW